MILSQGRKFVFVHIPKTGGTSFALAYEARAMKDDILVGDTPKARRRAARQKRLRTRGRLWKHMTLAESEGAIPVAGREGYMIATLVRNPWTRCLSYYLWLRGQGFDHPAVRAARAESFAGFLHRPEIAETLRHGAATGYVTAPGWEAAAVRYVRLEHLDTDLLPVETHLGFPLRPLPHANRTPPGSLPEEAYTPALADHVAALCAEDIDRFGYSFPAG